MATVPVPFFKPEHPVMDKIERVAAVVEGRRPDRPPVSFWYHFGPAEVPGPPAVEAHLRHVETYDLDFLKVMNDNRYPRPSRRPTAYCARRATWTG